MSDGLNREFMNNPDNFLQNRPIDIYPYLTASGMGDANPLAKARTDDAHVPEGVHDFDLARSATNGLVQLRCFADRAKAPTWASNRITAYWLPWDPDGTATVTWDTLNGSGARFVFTSGLAGCRILMSESGFHHISGQLSKKARAAESDNLRQGGRARAFSSTSGNAYGDGAFICGYLSGTGRGRNRIASWNFVAQSSTTNNAGQYIVTQVWLNNDLFNIDAN